MSFSNVATPSTTSPYTATSLYSTDPNVPVTGGAIAALSQLWQQYQNTSQNQYQWAQQQYAQNAGLTDDVVNQYLTQSKQLQGMGASDLSRYQGIFQPVENQLVSDAQSYAGAPRVQAEMGRAGAAAAQAADQGRQSALAQLQSYGIDPSSGRYASLDSAQRMQEAASVAGAQNQARLTTEATGRELQGQAIQTGERYPGQIATELGAGAQMLSGAAGTKLASEQVGANLLNSAQPWAQLAQTGAQGQTQQANQALGLGGGGIGGGKVTGAAYGGPIGAYDDGGGAIADAPPPAMPQAPGPMGPTTGGFVSQDASPSGGINTDDVPARLNAHEYVVPRDVSLWLGRKHFQTMIDKARQEMTGATAKPSMKPALNAPPTFRSQPMQQPAIPGAM